MIKVTIQMTPERVGALKANRELAATVLRAGIAEMEEIFPAHKRPTFAMLRERYVNVAALDELLEHIEAQAAEAGAVGTGTPASQEVA